MAGIREFNDVGELGMEKSIRKYKGAKKWERKVTERETHRCCSKKPRSYDDYEDYDYEY